MGGRGFRVYGFPPIGVAGGGLGVVQRVSTVAPSKLIGVWPLNETAGATVNCTNNAALNITNGHTGVTLGQPGPYSIASPLYDGANDSSNLYGATLASAFNGQEGSALIIGKVLDASVWTDSTYRYLFNFRSDDNNMARVYKSTLNNTIFFGYVANGTSKNITLTTSSLTWNVYCLTWSLSDNQVKAYVNAAQTGSTLTGLGTWSGALSATTTLVGAGTTTPTYVFSGWLSTMALFSRALSQPEIAYIYGGGPG